MSRTTLGAGRSEGFTDHRGDGFFREVMAPVAGALHQGVELLVGEDLQHPIEALDTGAGGEEKGQEFLGDLLLVPFRKIQDLLQSPKRCQRSQPSRVAMIALP